MQSKIIEILAFSQYLDYHDEREMYEYDCK